MTADAVAPAPPRWRDVFRGPQGRLIIGLLVLETLFALHFLTVATVMPAVLTDLGDISLYGASFWAASLMQLACIPIASGAVDRFGPRRVLVVLAVVYACGLLVAAFAPTMLFVVLGRSLQGIAAGGGYALSIGVVAKQMPEEHRARILALLATTWILPGLLGPGVGAMLVSTVGWRWAFAAPLPVLVICLVMILPALRVVPRVEDTDIRREAVALARRRGVGALRIAHVPLAPDARGGRGGRRPRVARPALAHPAGDVPRPSRPARGGGRRVPLVGDVRGRRLVRLADAHRGPRPVDRGGRRSASRVRRSRGPPGRGGSRGRSSDARSGAS